MDPFVGEIRIMPYGDGYVTRGWAPCQGQTLPIAQNSALFALLGVQYGGDGRTTFGLPDLRGRAIVGQGQGPGLQNYSQGTQVGTESVTLNSTQLAAHTHNLTGTVPVSTSNGQQTTPGGGYFAANPNEQYGSGVNPNGNMANVLSGTTGPAGGPDAHENRMPFLTLGYCIALQGVFPQRQ